MDDLIPADLAYDEDPVTDDDVTALAAWVEGMASSSDVDVNEVAADLVSADPDAEWTREAGPAASFRVTDLASAEWAMRKLAAIEWERRDIKIHADEWAARIDEWRKERDKPLANRAAFFKALLTQFAVAERERSNGRTKSVHLPSGDVKTRERKPAVIVDDEPAVIAWASDHLPGEVYDQVVKTTTKVLVSALREQVSTSAIVGRTVVSFECGHVLILGTHDVDPTDPALVLLCGECGEDRKVVGFMHDDKATILTPDGEVIPGLDLDPGGLSVTVAPIL